VPVAPLALEAPPAEVPAAELAEPEQPFFSVMLLDGQPIEFPVEMIGAEQDLGSGPIILEAHGRGVETATHKYIVFDSGDAALYDLAVDPDGMNNIVADPAWAGLIQELSAKLAAFPAPPAATPVVEAALVAAPDVPKVTVPAPVATSELPEPASPPSAIPAIPALATPAEAALPAAPVPATLEAKPSLPPLPKPSQVKLPDIGLPPGVGDEPEEASPVAALPVPPAPSVAKPASIELPQPGLPKPGAVPTLDSTAKPKLPPPPKPAAEEAEPEAPKPAMPPVPKPSEILSSKSSTEEKGSSSEELKQALMDEFDTDGDGKISEEESPSAEQLKQFTTRRREQSKVDRLGNKRKSRMEAESAVKNAMRELEEARLREEMTVREELEAHKSTLDKLRRNRERCDEEIAKLKQTDLSRREKTDATIAKISQEFEHDEELIRHGVRAKKAARLDCEDRIGELEDELQRLHAEETVRIKDEEEEDRRREKESRQAHERYLNRKKEAEEETGVRQTDLQNHNKQEAELKEGLGNKESQMQGRLRKIKFEEDDQHSRIEHEIERLEKNRDDFAGKESIEEDEIRTLSARIDARRIAVADEKKAERRLVVAEHEAEKLADEKDEETLSLPKPVIDSEEPPEPDLEPALPRKPEIKVAKPVEPKEVTAKPALPELPPKPKVTALPEPEIKVAKPVMPGLPAKPEPVVKAKAVEDDTLPAVIKPGSKPAKPLAIVADEKPAFSAAPKAKSVVADSAAELPALPQPPTSRDLPPLPTEAPVPSGEADVAEKSGEKKGFFGRLFEKKKKEATAEAAPSPSLPAPKTEGPEQELPPLPTPGAPASGKDLPALPPLPTKKPDLPPIPNAPDMAKEMERKNLERKLERIADDRAERISESKPDLPPLPASGSAPEKTAGLPPLPKPGGGPAALPALPKPSGAKPDLPPLTKPGGASTMPPIPKPDGKLDLPPLPKPKAGGAGNLPPLPPSK